jgi:hypothetical protein
MQVIGFMKMNNNVNIITAPGLQHWLQLTRVDLTFMVTPWWEVATLPTSL